jgi:hypothetical protein
MSLEDIARATGVGRETTKSRLRYALDRLRRCLAELYNPQESAPQILPPEGVKKPRSGPSFS